MTEPFVVSEDPEVQKYRREQIEEYTSFRAARAIDVGSARAFNEGDPVPKSTVERLKWDDLGLVERVPAKVRTDAVRAAGLAASDPVGTGDVPPTSDQRSKGTVK